MLSVSTLWLVFTVNFLVWGLMWAYMTRRYPELVAARFWSAGMLIAAAAPEIVLLHQVASSQALLLAAALMNVLACCLVEIGVGCFHDRPASWRNAILITGLSCAGLVFFVFVCDELPGRIAVYSLGEIVPISLTIRPLLSRYGYKRSRGACIAGAISILMAATFTARSVVALLNVDGNVIIRYFNPLQAELLVLLVFLSMLWNLGFLLMTIERLRDRFAKLALIDDLTGVANRRQLWLRLSEQCALAQRSGEPPALLAIDLDGFKQINDGFGHAAGDECLRQFARIALSQLRPGDLLARVGGDEFCVVLPATTLRDAEAIACRLLEGCRSEPEGGIHAAASVTASIGIARWSRSVGAAPEQLIALADQALYAAKQQGKNCYAICNTAPPLAPELEAESLIWRSC